MNCSKAESCRKPQSHDLGPPLELDGSASLLMSDARHQAVRALSYVLFSTPLRQTFRPRSLQLNIRRSCTEATLSLSRAMDNRLYTSFFILLAALANSATCWPMSRDELEHGTKVVRGSITMGASANSNGTTTARTNVLSKRDQCSSRWPRSSTDSFHLLAIDEIHQQNAEPDCLPFEPSASQIQETLRSRWPKQCIGLPNQDCEDHSGWSDRIVFYRDITRETLIGEQRPGCCAKGINGIQERESRGPDPEKTRFMAPFKIYSPVMKGLVRIAIWNSISFWLVIAMIVNTLVYNGFVTHNNINDINIRLVFLVITYAIANLAHQLYTNTLLYGNFTYVLYQACWTYICNNFIFVETAEYLNLVTKGHDSRGNDPFRRMYLPSLNQAASDTVWTGITSELFGKLERSTTYQLVVKDNDQPGNNHQLDGYPPSSRTSDGNWDVGHFLS